MVSIIQRSHELNLFSVDNLKNTLSGIQNDDIQPSEIDTLQSAVKNSEELKMMLRNLEKVKGFNLSENFKQIIKS